MQFSRYIVQTRGSIWDEVVLEGPGEVRTIGGKSLQIFMAGRQMFLFPEAALAAASHIGELPLPDGTTVFLFQSREEAHSKLDHERQSWQHSMERMQQEVEVILHQG